MKPTVKLIGEDGNVFSIIARCNRALMDVDPIVASDFVEKALSAGSYDEVLQLAMRYCEVN